MFLVHYQVLLAAATSLLRHSELLPLSSGGAASVDPEVLLGLGATAVMADDGEVVTMSSSDGGQVLLMAGEPIGEPIAMGGGFVMNTTDEIEQAFADVRAGRLGHLEPRSVSHG